MGHRPHWRSVLAASTLLASAAGAQPDLEWLQQFGTSADDGPHGLAFDGIGGVFVAGWTTGDLGDPNAGGADVFVGRYDADGHQMWMNQFGAQLDDDANAAASDDQGGVYVAGNTRGSLGGPNEGGIDAYLVRYNAAGFPLWIKQFGTEADDIAWVLASDGDGGVFLGGHTGGELGGPNAGTQDAYVAHFDRDGSRLWLRQFGTVEDDKASSIAPDGFGGVFVFGVTYGDLAGQNAGDLDLYLARIDPAGELAWTKQLGTPAYDQAQSAASDGEGGLFVSGRTGGDLVGANAGAFDAFVGRFDAGGAKVWLKQFGTDDYDMASTLVADGFGGAFVAGNTFGDLAAPNEGSADVFLARYDGTGNRPWIVQYGTPAQDFAFEGALATDGYGDVFVAGDTTGDLGDQNAGGADVFIARYDGICEPDCDNTGTLNVFDFLCFINQFNAGADYADCDGNGDLDLFDFLCFVNQFNAGC